MRKKVCILTHLLFILPPRFYAIRKNAMLLLELIKNQYLQIISLQFE